MCRITKHCVFDRVDDCVLSVAFCHRSGWAKGCQKGELGAVRVGWSYCKKVQFGLVTLKIFPRYCAKDNSKSHQFHSVWWQEKKKRVPGELGAVRVSWSNCKKVHFGLVTLIWFLRYCAKDDPKSHQLHLFDDKTRVPGESSAVSFGLVKSEGLLVWLQKGLVWFGCVLWSFP